MKQVTHEQFRRKNPEAFKRLKDYVAEECGLVTNESADTIRIRQRNDGAFRARICGGNQWHKVDLGEDNHWYHGDKKVA